MATGGEAALAPLLDTFLPGFPADGTGPAYPAASAVGIDRDVRSLIADLPAGQRKEFSTLLRTLDNPWLNLLLTGRPVRFSRLPPERRAAYLLGWSQSRLAVKRKAFHAAKRLSGGVYYSGPLGGQPHPLWSRIHYELPPSEPPMPDPYGGARPVRPTAEVEETTDVVVVGSGAGGGVVAERMVAAGYRVVVLEAGAWFSPEEYPRVERAAHEHLFYRHGVATTRDGAFGILAGETVGGSTAINWMTCLRPRPEARAEWARDGGMVGIDGPDFDRDLAAVSERIHVSTEESTVNPSNDALRRGAIALGYRQGVDWDIISRNAVGCRSRCGFCTFGCPYSARQATSVTFLAGAMRGGARVYDRTRVDSVEIEQGRARGVRATSRAGGRALSVRIRARAIVVSAGALQTPAVLWRSGIRSPGVGAGLRLDPTTALAVEFPFPVRTWSGPHQTVGVYKFQTTDEGAHGPWMEVAPAHPGLAAIALPWTGAERYRREMERLERIATPIVLVRDVGEGRVRFDGEGQPLYEYTLTARDRNNLVRGMVETARLVTAAGATRVLSLHMPPVEAGDGTRPISPADLDRFIAGVTAAGVRENSIALFSAHPLGSARAGPDARTSACGPSGEVHGVEGLWVADGALLPSAPGANPMLSILAVAWRVSERLRASLSASPQR